VAEWVELRAGPLRMWFDPEWAFLRRIRLGDREVLRGIYAPVRDAGWGTVPPRVSNVTVERDDASFRLGFEAECKRGAIDFAWRGAITGESDGTVRFAFRGVARSTFLRQRIGCCVLHPVKECAGKGCVVEKPDGSTEESRFPYYIAPHQPFLDVRALTWEVAPGLAAEVRCEGDTFETEDQRNWTDASFKTYCTPLALPRPVEVRAGAVVEQSVTLRLKGAVPVAGGTGSPCGLVTLGVGEQACAPLPRLGLGVASHGGPLSPMEALRLKALRLSHLRVELRPSEPGWREALTRACAEANAIGARLEVALLLSGEAEGELRLVAEAAKVLQPRVEHWLVFPATERAVSPPGLVPLARRYLAGARIGGGTNRYFTELNRDRPPVGELDLVAYSFNPQVHTFDEPSMMESIEGQRWTVLTTRQFAGSLPIAIGPITLKPRSRVAAEPGELPPNVDPRQASAFCAAWTLASLAALAELGVHSLTYYETTGWLGVMETDRGSPLSDELPAQPGFVFPVYHVFDGLAELAGGEVVPVASGDPLAVAGLAVRKAGMLRMLVANLTAEPLEAAVRGLPDLISFHRLDETSLTSLCRAPELARMKTGRLANARSGQHRLVLPPYALVRIEAAW